jgi:lipoic acid synthetase
MVDEGAGARELGADKMARNTARFDRDAPRLRKPDWIRVRLPSGNAVQSLKSRLRANSLVRKAWPGRSVTCGSVTW